MSDKCKPQVPVFIDDKSDSNYYGNIERHSPKILCKNKVLPSVVKTSDNCHGSTLAPIAPTPMARTPQHAANDATTPVDQISNAGVLHIPDEKDVPNEYEFEILRLRRRVEELECVVRDRDERNVRAISMLEDEMQYWRTYLHDHVGETFSGIQRRVMRIESTLMTLREKGSRVYPPLDLPAGWKKLP